MRVNEQMGRRYCESIGADPDEIVWGYWAGVNHWVSAPRWCWYS